MKSEKRDALTEKHQYLWSSILSPLEHQRDIESTNSVIDNQLFQMYREKSPPKKSDQDEITYLSQMKFFYLSYSGLSQQLAAGCEGDPVRFKYLVNSIEITQAMALELFGPKALLKINRSLLNQVIRRGEANDIASHLISKQDISELNARFPEINPQNPLEMKTNMLEHPILTAISYRNHTVLTMLKNKGLEVAVRTIDWNCSVDKFLQNTMRGEDKESRFVRHFDGKDVPITIAWIMSSLLLGQDKNIWSEDSAQINNKEKQQTVAACQDFGWWDNSLKALEAIADFQIRLQMTSNTWKSKKPVVDLSSITVTPRILRALFSILRHAANPDGGESVLVARNAYDWMVAQDPTFWESSGAKTDKNLMREWSEPNHRSNLLYYSSNTGEMLQTAIAELKQLDQIAEWLGPEREDVKKLRKGIINVATKGLDKNDIEMFEAEILELSSYEQGIKMAKQNKKRL